MMAGNTWCRVRCVTGAWLRQTIEMNRVSCVEKRDGQRAARGWQHCWRKNKLEKIVEFGQLARMERLRERCTHRDFWSIEVLKALGKQLVDDGRLDRITLYSAVLTADCPELDTKDWQEDDYDQQGHLLDPIKVKEGKRVESDSVLKQKLFDYVPESECAEREGRPTH